MNHKFLKSNLWHRLLADAGLKNDTKLDLIYKAVCSSKKMELDSFLQSMVKVAELRFHETVDDSHTALRALLDHHLLPLYARLKPTSQTTVIHDPLSERVLKEVSQSLLQVFRVYFLQSQGKYERQVFEVLKDFDLCPDVVNKVTVFKLMN